MSHSYRAPIPDLIPFKIGNHDYNGTRIEVVPIKTMGHGLCYKFNMSNPFPFYGNMLHMVIGSSDLGTDKLNKVDLFIAAENTWQGTSDEPEPSWLEP